MSNENVLLILWENYGSSFFCLNSPTRRLSKKERKNMHRLLILFLPLLLLSCNQDDGITNNDPEQRYTIDSHDATAIAAFGALDYRVYYPREFTGATQVIHVSRGGNGLGDDRGELIPYVQAYVQEGYVVVQVNHRFAGSDIEKIARFRGEEIAFIAGKVADGTLDYGGFNGTIDGSSQGYAGHSGGCMEGLLAAGTEMTHGNYLVPEIKAVYGMSPAGYRPDQFGITQNPVGYSQIGATAVFVIIGEEEKDVNGPGRFMAEDWRLQAYEAMTDAGPRHQALVKGPDTDHLDIKGDNPAVEQYNTANSLALFATYVRGEDREAEIGQLATPMDNTVELSRKGIP